MVARVKTTAGVEFLESIPPDYPGALARRQYLQDHLSISENEAVVIYRHSVARTRSYVSRQIDPAQGFPTSVPGPPEGQPYGEQCFADEPSTAVKVGYDLFLVPRRMLSQENPPRERALTEEILALVGNGQLPPTDGGPKME